MIMTVLPTQVSQLLALHLDNILPAWEKQLATCNTQVSKIMFGLIGCRNTKCITVYIVYTREYKLYAHDAILHDKNTASTSRFS